ncbi:bile acid:sodium symporter family protein [Fuscibacter oryzae]|uniref:Bile acid:sodium symporter n=1 Tax=Fuscibacter oryzae TaxID=2803939 RepID=A0A8J7MX52_9RHOB|nr:bile acid:sodium symporter family protein [Fuscibacter oryzae]MBL4929419.1 bile acid:sodium symporter [Fuscibacter oryzae]
MAGGREVFAVFGKKVGIDPYMIMLLGAMTLGLLLPASGAAAAVLGRVTYVAIALLFFLYGAKLEPRAIRAGFLDWKLQVFVALVTFVLFPLLCIVLSRLAGGVLRPEILMGIVFLGILPSTVQSSIAFTSIANGNVAGAICAASISNFAGVALTPLLAAALISSDQVEISFDAVLRIVVQIVLPFVAGQIVRPWIGPALQRRRAMTLLVDRGSILLIVYSAFSAGTASGLWSEVPAMQIVIMVAAMAALLLVVLGLATFLARASGMDAQSRIAALFCGSTKSLASGLPIAASIFPHAVLGAVVLPLMAYHMIQLLSCAAISQRFSAKKWAESQV